MFEHKVNHSVLYSPLEIIVDMNKPGRKIELGCYRAEKGDKWYYYDFKDVTSTRLVYLYKKDQNNQQTPFIFMQRFYTLNNFKNIKEAIDQEEEFMANNGA